MDSENSKKKRIASLILAGIIALLFWSELIFSNLPSLFNVTTPADTLGWSIGATGLYFSVLAILDLIGGIGAALYIGSILKSSDMAWVQKIVLVTVVALFAYGAVQFIIAFLLPAELQIVYWVIGVVYVLIAFGLRALFQRGR